MHDTASRLTGRGVSGDQIRDDTKLLLLLLLKLIVDAPLCRHKRKDREKALAMRALSCKGVKKC